MLVLGVAVSGLIAQPQNAGDQVRLMAAVADADNGNESWTGDSRCWDASAALPWAVSL